jgi:thiol-disulfide isomerase/thioredoxin
MRHIIVVILIVFSGFASYAQHVSIIKVTDLEKRIKNNSDTTYIVNFWATWCSPCVKELPDFDSIAVDYKNKLVKVILVSMDFKEDVQSKLIPFISSKKIKSEVVVLDETNGNYFIPKISQQWSGSLPATLIVNNKKQENIFFEKKLNYFFLKTEIENIISKN